jgi:hypothetical protein
MSKKETASFGKLQRRMVKRSALISQLEAEAIRHKNLAREAAEQSLFDLADYHFRAASMLRREHILPLAQDQKLDRKIINGLVTGAILAMYIMKKDFGQDLNLPGFTLPKALLEQCGE